MSGANFIDTNIWVYAHLDAPADERSSKAWDFTQQCQNRVISAQVCAEYFNTMRRNGEDEATIGRNIERMLQRCRVQSMDSTTIRRTQHIRNRYGFSIWDSQVAAAALQAGCTTLYSEDMQHGQWVESLVIINPLLVG
ncbi:PIN domain-containing protein [Ectothiorhodospiraceae bacterium BW-2]|nr:PIN domain-containing protein [Ectothiorhodospiraceae bacterium BW-2]